jgi:hypothetical protein
MPLHLPTIGMVGDPFLVRFDVRRGQDRIAEDLLGLRVAHDDAPAWRLGNHQAHGDGPEHGIETCPLLIESRLSGSDIVNVRGGAHPSVDLTAFLERVDAADMPTIGAVAGAADTQLDVVCFPDAMACDLAATIRGRSSGWIASVQPSPSGVTGWLV